MDALTRPLIILAIAISLTILLLRHYWLEFDITLTVGITSGLILAALLLVFFRSKRHFESRSDALIRIESASSLNSTLSSAEAGKASWPAIPHKVEAGIRWNYTRLTLPLVGSLSILLASFIIPIQPIIHETPSAAPRTWRELSANLEELKEQDVIQNAYIKEIESKLKELKEQPEKDWYSHPSLEATENINHSHKQELQQLSKNLDQAQTALNQLKEHSRNLTEAQRTQLMEQFNNAVDALEKGNMKPNKKLLELLKNIDPSMLNSLSPEEAKQLRERFQKLSEELKKQLRDGLAPGEQLDELEQANLPDTFNQDGNGGEDSEDGEKHAPKVLGRKSEAFDLLKNEKLDSRNKNNLAPGDLLETTDGGEHEVDLSATTEQEGGNTENQGAGGDSVWKGNYLPDEKRALKKFFK